MLRLDGCPALYQWDSGRRLTVDERSITEIHFWIYGMDKAAVCGIYEENGGRYADIPNAMLTQSRHDVIAYAVHNGHTNGRAYFRVTARAQPEDYVYTETEVKRWDDLGDRIKALEDAGFLTRETDPTVPAWAKAATKPAYTAAEVGAMPADTPIPEAYTLPAATADTLGGVKVGEGLEMDDSGVLGIVPEGSYELIGTLNISEDGIRRFVCTEFGDGTPLSLARVLVRTTSAASGTDNIAFAFTFTASNGGTLYNYNPNTIRKNYATICYCFADRFKNGIVSVEGIVASTDDSAVPSNNFRPYKSVKIGEYSPIAMVEVSAESDIPIGTKIDVLGVRA